MHVDLKFTGDGILAFIGGALALIGVWLSNRQSVLNLQKQLDVEKQARKEEQDQRQRALALALLVEIDGFYMHNLEGRSEWFNSWKKMNCDPLARGIFMVTVGMPYSVYEACAGQIGGFHATAARAVVTCWGALSEYLEMLQRYEHHLERNWSNANNEVVRQMTLKLQEGIEKSAEYAVKIALPTCQYLAQVAGTDFQKLAIAKEVTITPIPSQEL